MEEGKKETLKSLSALLRWADKYQAEDMPEIQKLLAQYPEKVISIYEYANFQDKMYAG